MIKRSSKETKETTTKAGQIALHTMLEMRRPPPATQSFIVSGARRTYETGAYTQEYYPLQYLSEGSPISHLKFALKHEPLDLGIVHEAF